MENWLYDKATMDLVSGHYRTGESLPDELFEKVCKGMLKPVLFQLRREVTSKFSVKFLAG